MTMGFGCAPAATCHHPTTATTRRSAAAAATTTAAASRGTRRTRDNAPKKNTSAGRRRRTSSARRAKCDGVGVVFFAPKHLRTRSNLPPFSSSVSWGPGKQRSVKNSRGLSGVRLLRYRCVDRTNNQAKSARDIRGRRRGGVSRDGKRDISGSGIVQRVVVSTGGGIVTQRNNWMHLHNGVTVCLQGNHRTLARRVHKDGIGARPC